MWKNRSARTIPWGAHVVNTEERHRTAFVELELAAVWQGHERGVVTGQEVHERLEELERLLWRRVLGRLRKVTPGASVHVGFAVGEQPAQELA
jgi:polynucleotide 5'-kinase involved in rRNA processing